MSHGDRSDSIFGRRGPAAPAAESIDAQALAQLRSDLDCEPASFNQVITQFIGQLSPRVGAIRDAIEHADAKAMGAAAHVLRGSSLLVGAQVMAEMCREVELLARSGTIDGAAALLTLLADEAGRVRGALTAVCAAGDSQ